MNPILVWILIFVVVFALLRRSRSKQAIADPKLGILDLTGGASDGIIAEDKAALGGLFATVQESTTTVPQCDVLFLYATLGNGGSLQGLERYLRGTIRDSRAKIVIVASENPNPPPPQEKPLYGRANLVITLARKGTSFPQFFRSLFEQMKQGKSMPMAWVKLAPQNPNADHPGCPDTVFLCEVGGITFR